MVCPQDIRILILGVCEYVAIEGKRGFAYAIKLRVLRWGVYPVEPNAITKFFFIRGRQKVRKKLEDADFEDGG